MEAILEAKEHKVSMQMVASLFCGSWPEIGTLRWTSTLMLCVFDRSLWQGQQLFRVKWKGYSLKETTWEPRSNFKQGRFIASLNSVLSALVSLIPTSTTQANLSLHAGGRRRTGCGI